MNGRGLIGLGALVLVLLAGRETDAPPPPQPAGDPTLRITRLYQPEPGLGCWEARDTTPAERFHRSCVRAGESAAVWRWYLALREGQPYDWRTMPDD